MMQRTFCALVAAVFVAALVLMPATAFAQEGPTTLAWKFAVGDSMTCEVADSMNLDTGMGISLNQSQTVGYSFRVEKVENGIATIKVTVASVKIVAQTPFGAAQNWDSKEDPKGERANNPALKPYVALLGKSFTVKVHVRGTVQGVEGWDDVLKAMMDAVGSGRMAAQAREQVQTQWSGEAVKQQFQSIFGILPEGPVVAGASWNLRTEQALPRVGKMKNNLTMSFKEVKRQANADGSNPTTIAVIGITAETELEGGGAQGPMGPVEVNLKNATTNGIAQFDIGRGRAISSTVETTITVALKAGRDMEFEQAIKQSRTVTFGSAAAPQQTPERTPGNGDEDGDF